MNQRSILYITQASSPSSAIHTNTQRRVMAIQKAGYSVRVFVHRPGHFRKDFLHLVGTLKNTRSIIIRIDGSGVLDKFTLLSLRLPHIPIYWELHGFSQESLPDKPSYTQRAVFFKHKMRRLLLSYLVDTIIFISSELLSFAHTQIHIRKNRIIQNFILPHEYRVPDTSHNTVLDTLSSRFLVCWGGGAYLSWQALDIFEQVAKKTYSQDPTILFILIGSYTWHPFTWKKNILFFPDLPRAEFLTLVSRMSVCLALYHKPPHVPFYFSPLKILDYMSFAKPVIATDHQSIHPYITNGVNGIFTKNNPSQIAKSILMLKKIPRLAAKIGANAHKDIVKFHTINEASKKYADLLNQTNTHNTPTA